MIIIKEKCLACGVCSDLCSHGAVTYPAKNGTGYCAPHIDKAICVSCGECLIECPGAAITED